MPTRGTVVLAAAAGTLLIVRSGGHCPAPRRVPGLGRHQGGLSFLQQPRVDEGVTLAGHFAATRARFVATPGPLVLLHDTTEFSFTRDNPEAAGQLTLLKTRHATLTLCGLLMHSRLVLTAQGVPLGLAAVKFWTRDKFKGTNALKGKFNPARIPIEREESVRWLENLTQST